MQRHRELAGAPVRSATEAWGVLCKLVSDTLTVSDEISEDDVRSALTPLDGIGPALIAGGHLRTSPVTVVSNSLHLEISVVTGTGAIGVDENLNPVPGGGSASADWVMHLPTPATLVAVVMSAARKSVHLSVEPPPDVQPAAKGMELIDLGALKNLE